MQLLDHPEKQPLTCEPPMSLAANEQKISNNYSLLHLVHLHKLSITSNIIILKPHPSFATSYLRAAQVMRLDPNFFCINIVIKIKELIISIIHTRIRSSGHRVDKSLEAGTQYHSRS